MIFRDAPFDNSGTSPFGHKINNYLKKTQFFFVFLYFYLSYSFFLYFCSVKKRFIIAEVAQLVEHNLAKVRVASSSLVFRSNPDK